MPKFRKKPVEIEAMQFIRDMEVIANLDKFMEGRGEFSTCFSRLRISTLEGTMEAQPGDWIIKGVKGEFYPCKPDIFEQTYEAMEGKQ